MIALEIRKQMWTADGLRTLEVSVEIPKNSLTCIFGPSGSGKTTLLRMIAGLVKPDKGSISINSIPVYDSGKKINLVPQRRHVGYMFQDYALFPNMSVEKNIRFAQGREKDNVLVEALIHEFGLDNLRRQKPDKLSGGQRQRVALARAIAAKPDVLLLDEPLSAVDEEMRLSLQDEIIKVHTIFSMTTLMVSHDRTEIARLSTHLLPIGQGKADELKKTAFL
ncbi:ABC transporter ATP-binding protein [Proteiniphilum sp.]|nr:ATP-binding cassette domain-containing protein [Proteiniphilum sp.]MEA4917536.1 ATP-binding cassette domain-containing protein [Proteiniphilum sp.]